MIEFSHTKSLILSKFVENLNDTAAHKFFFIFVTPGYRLSEGIMIESAQVFVCTTAPLTGRKNTSKRKRKEETGHAWNN